MKRSLFAALSVMVVFSVALTACGTTTPQPSASPSGSVSVDAVSTAVAATLTAMPGAAATATGESHELPSATPAIPGQIRLATYVNIDHNLYVWSPGQSEFTQITSTGDAILAYPSPDGTLVAFTRTPGDDSFSVDLVRSDGADHHTLFSREQFLSLPRPEGTLNSAPTELRWIPGTHLLAMTVRYVIIGPGTFPGKDLIVINADDGTFRTLLTESAGFTFAFSPDGKYISTGLADGVNLYGSSGKPAAPAKFFGFPFVNTASEYQYMPDFRWSVDGSKFAFFIPPITPFGETVGITRLIEVKASDASYTTPVSATMEYQYPQEISPDFSRVAYTVNTDRTLGVVDLHIVSMDGKSDEIYEKGKKTSMFNWSPDSLHFLYAYNDGTNNVANLGTMGSAPQQITSVTSMRNAAWIDATHYLIVDKPASGWKIWYGQIGGDPVEIYSDDNPNYNETSLNINR